MIGIGIDTGGTFTDAAIYDDQACKVLATCKTHTTHDDLSVCIGNALDKLPAELVAQAARISLSTTLATNACVEGKGGRARLVIAGTDENTLHRVEAPKKYGLQYADVLPIDFRGSADGTKAAVPDWEAVCREHAAFFEGADSFGIAGLYALNNGAVVERSGSEHLKERYGKPVVMAVKVADSLNVFERGATALLNARLIPVIDEFVKAMRRALDARGMDVPIGIVRSNGTLMSAAFAQVSPVETILSGPASSTVGALHLAQADEALVVDIGGTTSDICVVHGGLPVSSGGIRIGGWRTQVKGARIDTIALGGDTRVVVNRAGNLEMTNRRALPLCIAAHRWPQVKDMLRKFITHIHPSPTPYHEAFYLAKELRNPERYTAAEIEFAAELEEGPMSLTDARLEKIGVDTRRLENEGIVMRCGFTPTDAMHVLGDYTGYDVEASRLGALCLAKSFPYDPEEFGEDARAEDIARKVYDLACHRLYRQIVRVLLQDRYPALRDAELSDQLTGLIDDAWRRFADGVPASPFDVNFTTDMALIGIGAPTHVFLPTVARALKAPCISPEFASVANAVGAICARTIAETVVRVVPHRIACGVVDGYMVITPNDNHMVTELDDALEEAQAVAREHACAEASARGAEGEVSCMVEVQRITLAGTAEAIASKTDQALTAEWRAIAIASAQG